MAAPGKLWVPVSFRSLLSGLGVSVVQIMLRNITTEPLRLLIHGAETSIKNLTPLKAEIRRDTFESVSATVAFGK